MIPNLHPLLSRQIKRNGIVISDALAPEMLSLLTHINNSYHEMDANHYLDIHSFEVASKEMFELRQNLQKEKEIVQSLMSDALCIFNASWEIVDLNETALKVLLFKSKKEITGKQLNSLFTLYENTNNDSKETKISQLEVLLETGEAYHCEHGCIKLSNGIMLPISFSVNPLPLNNGLFNGAVLVFRDIKEMLERELALKSAVKLAQKSNNAKTIFLANMSHEVRTPMNGIMGMLQLLLTTDLSDKQKEYVTKSYESALSLLKILGDILDYSKIESGKVSFESIDFSIKKEIETIINNYHPQASQKEIDLQLHLDAAIPEMIKGDPYRLKQIVSNLLNNALKFTPSKGTITVEFNLIDIVNNIISIRGAVTDTGIGVPREAQAFIFEMFSQADQSTTRKFGGTGLGLAITKQLVDLLGGEIHIDSVEGSGSTFYFILKFSTHEVSPSINANLPSEAPSKIEPLPMKASILVVEDNQLNQIITRDIIVALGGIPVIVGSGDDALDIITKEHFDLILLDCHLPGIDGYETAFRIREMEMKGDNSHQIIIALTANALQGTRELCLQAGMDDYLTKPVNIKQLRDIIVKHLESNLSQ